MAHPPVRTFSSVLRGFRAARKINGVELAKLAGIPTRSISRWERRGVRPRESDARKLIAVIATMNYASAVELSAILDIPPPRDPSPPPPPPPPPPAPVVIVAAPPPEPEKPAPPPPVPAELAIDPVEAAVLRAAESLEMSPRVLRPVLVRFLGHVAALDLTPTEAATRVG